MFILKDTFVELHGGPIILVIRILTDAQKIEGYNITSHSMRLNQYELANVKETPVAFSSGRQRMNEMRYDKNAKRRLDIVLSIIKKVTEPSQNKSPAKKKKKKIKYQY